MQKTRLDILMESRGLSPSRSQAQRLIMAGSVRVNHQVVLKPGTKVDPEDVIEISESPRFVSRGGEKLLSALQAFHLTSLADRVCVDVGASTGGFTDCLLQHGAKKVFAVDVGYGVLDWKIRNDARVVVMEKQNARYITTFHEPIDLVVIDASFISLRTLLPVVRRWLNAQKGEVVALIKPQFEAGRSETARGSGVIRDPEIHRAVLRQVLDFAQKEGYTADGLIRSPLTGPKGNIEFLAHLIYPGETPADVERLIEGLPWNEGTTADQPCQPEPDGKLK
jgi:23S rRNA (cytidine1920-2'-O)/16S rRNA (cytidine1409-2'-O)-methyltransferase